MQLKHSQEINDPDGVCSGSVSHFTYLISQKEMISKSLKTQHRLRLVSVIPLRLKQ